jgi:inner membrane transporter RhtA
VFHYLGPAFAVLLFARVEVLGVAWLRIASAALVFALWRRPWRAFAALDSEGRRLLCAWGAVLAAMNACFYVAIDRLPLGTVAAIEFLPVIALAALGARGGRNAAALAAAVAGVYLLTGVQFEGEPLGVAVAFANAVLFAVYIVLAHRVARHGGLSGIDGLAASMLIALVVVTPMGGWQVVPALTDPVALLAGVGVGICSSVIPYVSDQLAMRRVSRAAYALMVSLLPATRRCRPRASWRAWRSSSPAWRCTGSARKSSREPLQRNQERRRPRPVLTQEHRPGTPYEAAQHQRDENRVVELPEDRDEVGHEVERHREVDEREPRRELPPGRDARVRQQPLEQHRAVGHQPRDHADVPLPRAGGERDQEGRVDHDEDGESAEQPAHGP